MAHIIKQKAKKLNIICKDKYTELEEDEVELKYNFIDFRAICQHLKADNVKEAELQAAFGHYKHDKHEFIADIIEAYYIDDDEKLPFENKILIHNFNCNIKTRKNIYEYVLEKHLNKNELNNKNFVTIAVTIIKELYPQINIQQFKSILIKSNINGEIFIKGHSNFRNKLKFAKLFISINGYNKKNICDIYTKIQNGKWLFEKSKTETNDIDSTMNINEEEKKDATECKNDNNNQNIEIYDVGTRFYFWNCFIQHKHYIKANYSNLKEEMLQNKIIDFNIKRWQYLESEVKTDLLTTEVKKIQSNGYWKRFYNIDLNSLFTAQHFTSLKLYTDYTTECSLFCSTLRSSNMSL
eukprot:523010_1